MAGHWGEGKQKLRVAERCRSAPNTEFTTINLLYLLCVLFFFTFYLLLLWTRRSKITRNSEQKQTNEKKYYKSLSVTFHTETLNISWKITSIYSHWWVYDCCVEAGGGGRAALRVALSSLLSAWKCAVCVCGSLLVCFLPAATCDECVLLELQPFRVSKNLNAAKIKVLKCQILNLYKKNVSQIINNSNEMRNAAVTEPTVTLSRRTHIFSPNTQTDRQTDEGEEASEVSRNRC